MSEAELRKSLRAAVGDEPPLNFDADALIERAQGVRAARKRRRALVAVGVATVVLMGTVLSLPGVFSVRDGGLNGGVIDALSGRDLTTSVPPSVGTVLPEAAPTPSGSVSTRSPGAQVPGIGFPGGQSSGAVVTAPPGSGVFDAPSPEKLKILSGYLAGRFADVVPGVSEVRAEFADDATKGRSGVVSGFVYFVDGEGSGGVVIHLSSPPAVVTADEFCAGMTCEYKERQSDGTVLGFARSSSGSSPNLMSLSVAHFRADGTVAQITGYNYDPAQGGKIRDKVPVTVDQLAALVTDPKLFAF